MSKFADAMTGAGGLLSMIPGAQPFALGAMGLGFLGNMFKSPEAVDKNVYRPNFQFGGVMGDVERDEVVQTPDGQMAEIGGGTHASGNDTTIVAPEGTAVYSDSISIDGKTMAERKKARERRMNKLQKEAAKIAEDMEKDPIDAISRQSNERILEQILADYIKEQMEEEADMQVQQIVSQTEEASEMPMGEEMPMMKYGGKMKKKYGYGGKMKKYGNGGVMTSMQRGITNSFFDLNDVIGQASGAAADARMFGNVGQGSAPVPDTLRSVGSRLADDPLSLARSADSPNIVAKQLNPLFDEPYKPEYYLYEPPPPPPPDDELNPWSKAGSLANIFAPTAITLAQRLGDRKNPNYFEGYGAEGLRTQGRAFGAAAGQRDAALGDVSRATAAQRQRTQQGARGINTMRAMDSATFGQAGRQRQDIRNQYTQHIANLFRERAGMQNQIDQVRMRGAAQADIADRQDRAAFHTNLARSVTQGAKSAQHYGKMQDKSETLTREQYNQWLQERIDEYNRMLATISGQ